MATKSANLYARIEPDVKERANAITMFYKQIILQNGLPFDVKLPAPRVPDVSKLTETELNAELEKGFADIAAGRTQKADEAFADIRRARGI